MQKTVVINVVGLTTGQLGPHTPALRQWAAGRQVLPIKPVLPAVTCSAQATYLTGQYPNRHGIVANGWYFADECEVKLWRQSNRLVLAPKIWELARQAAEAKGQRFTCANLFWWYNMYSSVDYSVTPRPQYLADGRKMPDCYSQPASLRDELQAELGTFPLFDFWGPRTSIRSSRWIAQASQHVERKHNPTLTFIYLPHLDYNSQRYGPQHPSVVTDLQQIDAVCGDLIHFYEQRGARVIVLSEYGITPVRRPVHLNRALRQAGLLQVRTERGLELLDAGASRAFAMADHQVAHVYINDPACTAQVRQILNETPGVELVLDQAGQALHHLDHPRSGQLVAVADPESWFTYYYWLDDACAPDFARIVDIHKKPGYDPLEMLVDPKIPLPWLKVGFTLLKKKLGFRYLMDVIPLDAGLIGGSHGRVPEDMRDWPVYIGEPELAPAADHLLAHQVFEKISQNLGFLA
ncbi:MAG: alkaline phosphatase family protein [Bernardetiaceae bacterium]|jgi:predicted AlkP superfamily pyrophosphatase or phosphodiesterase|nr:alkaline phosphatase family protein [Bernardetiaceae bacterium]